MATKNIEVLVGQKPAGEIDPSKTGQSVAQQPKEEVGGRIWYQRLMECWSCHGVSWVNYDTDRYHDYTCCYCGADNWF